MKKVAIILFTFILTLATSACASSDNSVSSESISANSQVASSNLSEEPSETNSMLESPENSELSAEDLQITFGAERFEFGGQPIATALMTVTNTLEVPIEFASTSIEVYDANGILLEVKDIVPIIPSRLNPGETAYIDSRIDSSDNAFSTEEIDNYTLSYKIRQTSPIEPLNIEVTQFQYNPSSSAVKMQGVAKNIGTEDITNTIHVYLPIFWPDGNFAGVLSGTISGIPAGTETAFKGQYTWKNPNNDYAQCTYGEPIFSLY